MISIFIVVIQIKTIISQILFLINTVYLSGEIDFVHKQ